MSKIDSSTSYIVGGGTFGLFARFWQLGLQKRAMSHYLPGHCLSVAIFATVGYYAFHHDQKMQLILAHGSAMYDAKREAQRKQIHEKVLEVKEKEDKVKQLIKRMLDDQQQEQQQNE